jgi:transcriptional regulator with XRE-family HTH domain
MKLFKNIRENMGYSQRQLAHKADLSFRTIQLLESGVHDPKISTLEQITVALGYPRNGIVQSLQNFLSAKDDSVKHISAGIVASGESSWKIYLFDFVDHFRKQPQEDLILEPPVSMTTPRIRALVTSVVETLCREQKISVPWWCEGVQRLSQPWFVSGIENLKAMALQESPSIFRKRNIFVLKNFLDRV